MNKIKNYSKRLVDLTGKRFARLTVIELWGRENNRTFWNCFCDCGNAAPKIEAYRLKTGGTKSCGCYKLGRAREANTRHGEKTKNYCSPEYKSYTEAKGRCTNTSNQRFNYYGGRGIEFRFNSFEEFLTEVGRRPTPKHSLDRINNNGHYEKDNIRWATAREQSNNTRRNHKLTINGKTLPISEWALFTEIDYYAILARTRLGWCDMCAVYALPRFGCKHKTGEGWTVFGNHQDAYSLTAKGAQLARELSGK